MRVVVVGANGQLGTDVCAAYEAEHHTVVPILHAMLDVRDADVVKRILESARPDLVVNTAAMHDVEACEADPHMAHEVNVIGARNLAARSRALGCTLLHISSDYVFDGLKGSPYTETDQPKPLNVYGKTKLEGEEAIRSITPRHIIVRTSGLYGMAPCRAKQGGNFVRLMLRLAKEQGLVRVASDEVVTPTYTRDLARQIVRLTKTGDVGTYHATSQGETSWLEFARAVFALARLSPTVHEALAADFPRKVVRPKYSVLENAALARSGQDIMPHWRESLADYIEALV